MKLYQPTCWKPFQCTASQCGDNCCIGWEIDIDPNSYARYQAVSGAFGDTLRANIQSGETPCFKMIGERCAMLDGENLCQIYRRWGKEGLCQICRDHPLFTDTFGTRRETGLGLCCEEAARLLFTDRKPLTLYAADTSEPECPEEVETILVERMTAVRDRLFALLEKAVGTSRGILTAPETGAATATEIRAANHDTFALVSAIRRMWEAR